MNNIKNKKYFKLFSCCIPVKGAKRSIICDLQRDKYYFIPNELCDFLEQKEYYNAEALNENANTPLNDFLEYLYQNELGFYTDEPTNFPKIDSGWESPRQFTNAIIDINEKTNHDYSLIEKEFSSVGVGALEIRIFQMISKEKLIEILNFFHNSRLRSIYLLLPKADYLTDNFFQEIVKKNQRIARIIITNAEEERVYKTKSPGIAIIAYTRQEVSSENCCGNISPAYFTANIDLFNESKKFNNCLNRKIAIDSEGFVKNCPSMKQNFGTLRVGLLKNLFENQEFKKKWYIKKDDISICKSCEFRYICTDCRAYLSSEEDNKSKPSKCNYNPYTAQWE